MNKTIQHALDEKAALALLEKGNVNLKISHNNIETIIQLDQKNETCAVHSYNHRIIYDQRKLEENKEAYLSRQLDVHREYCQQTMQELSQAYADFHEMLQPINEEIQNQPTGLSYFLFYPFIWARQQRLKPIIRKAIEARKEAVTAYNILKEVFDYGTKFFEKQIPAYQAKLNPEGVKSLEECINITKEISHLYARMLATKKKEIEEIQSLYDALFGKKQNE